jgi:hypothetical protein
MKLLRTSAIIVVDVGGVFWGHEKRKNAQQSKLILG